MYEIRFHGRGGQGAVVASTVLASAFFKEKKFVQAFPNFGSERTGAPVVSFCRIDDRPIRVREPVSEPNALIIQDRTLLHQVDMLSGLRRDGYLLINSSRTLAELGLEEFASSFKRRHLRCVPAGTLARQFVGRPLPNAALLGGFAALTRIIGLPAVEAAIREAFSGAVADGNVEAARAAFHVVTEQQKELTDA